MVVLIICLSSLYLKVGWKYILEKTTRPCEHVRELFKISIPIQFKLAELKADEHQLKPLVSEQSASLSS